MAYTIQNLIDNFGKEYKLSLACGSQLLNREISWAENISNMEDCDFLTERELVIFSGQNGESEAQILAFLKRMKEMQTGAVMLHSGPLLTMRPYMLDYCKQNDLPLLILPWGESLHSLLRVVCRDILYEQMSSFDAGQIFKSMIFYPREAKQHYKELEERGFELQGNYVIYVFNIHFKKGEPDNFLTDFKFHNDRFMESVNLHFGFWVYEGTGGRQYILIVNSSKESKLDQVTKRFQTGLEKYRSFHFTIGVGPKNGTLQSLADSFKKAIRTVQLAETEKCSPLCYDDLGIDKILLAVDNTEVLKEYYNELIGELITYDNNNGTEYVKVLRLYLENEGSVQRVADLLFVHRNTINYQMNRVREILQVDISSLTERFRLMLAIRIGEILS